MHKNYNKFHFTDLASELIDVKAKGEGNVKVSEIVLSEEDAVRYRKSAGRYVTLQTDEFGLLEPSDKSRLTSILTSQLKRILPRGKYLVVGLGNERLTADALGAEVCRRIDATKNMSLAPSVSGNTGVESFDVIYGVTHAVKPSAVIAVDSLAAAAVERLGKVIQICDSGITPGSGVSNHKKPLNFFSLGVPVIGLGVPLVVYASTIIRETGGDDEGYESMLVTPKDVDFVVASVADVIASAINAL